jgi:hypothetical protein
MDWARPVARLRKKVGNTHVGTGVLVAGDVVVTCAHVVADALELSNETAGPGVALSIDFPFADISDLKVEVSKWFPKIDPSGNRANDLAVLTLDKPELVEPIEPCLIAETDPKLGISFSSQGFPAGWPHGALAEGSLQAFDARGWIVAVPNTGFGHFIEPGFSGAPAFAGLREDINAQEIIGLCVTADVEGKAARLIPPAQLADAVRSAISPYRWLENFNQRDAGYYFGREELTEALWEEVGSQRFVLLAGPAGSGKSSLLQAGLLAKARSEKIGTLAMRPLADARGELARTLGLPTHAPRDDEAFHRAVQVHIEAKSLLLGIDQAEELVHGPNREQAAQFLQLLADLRERFDGLQIALAARSDELPALLAAQPRSRLLERNLRYIDELGQKELRAAIERPAARLRVGFPPKLVTRIVNDVLKEPRVPLPILQLCLSRLWLSASINDQAYEDLGGLTGVLANHAKSILEQFLADTQKLPRAVRLLLEFGLGGRPLLGRRSIWSILTERERQEPPIGTITRDKGLTSKPATLVEAFDRLYGHVVLQLVDVGERGEDLRRRVRMSNLGVSEKRIVRALAKGRLVVISRDPANGEEIAELAHDSLLTKWDRLSQWIEAQRDHLRLRSQLQREAQYWDTRGRPAAYRWSDERALEAAKMMDELSYTPSDREAMFLGPVSRTAMLAKLKDANTGHDERATIGVRLALQGENRPGTGVTNGIPDIVWCKVPSGRVRLSDGAGEFDVNNFSIARYPVTYAQYLPFLKDGYHNALWWAGLDTRYYEEPGRQIPPLYGNHPAVNVDWMEAVAYSRWLSRQLQSTVRLPTEWEWQHAATRGRPDFEFPWGPQWDPNRANTYENGLNRTVAVGLYPQDTSDDTPLDLAGNVWEWCINEYLTPTVDIRFDGLESRAIRGGAGSNTSKYARTSFRNHYRPNYRFDALGFRLVRIDMPT